MDKIPEYILTALAAIWVVIAPIQGLLLALGALILIDMILGVWRALKQGQSVRPSQAIRQTIGKATKYTLAVVAGFALDYIIGDTSVLAVARGFSLAVGVAECSSLAENFFKITGINIKEVLNKVFKPANSPKDAE
jgi:hypothetical protein